MPTRQGVIPSMSTGSGPTCQLAPDMMHTRAMLLFVFYEDVTYTIALSKAQAQRWSGLLTGPIEKWPSCRLADGLPYLSSDAARPGGNRTVVQPLDPGPHAAA